MCIHICTKLNKITVDSNNFFPLHFTTPCPRLYDSLHINNYRSTYSTALSERHIHAHTVRIYTQAHFTRYRRSGFLVPNTCHSHSASRSITHRYLSHIDIDCYSNIGGNDSRQYTQRHQLIRYFFTCIILHTFSHEQRTISLIPIIISTFTHPESIIYIHILLTMYSH